METRAEPTPARPYDPTLQERASIERRFIWIVTLLAVALAAFPLLYAQIARPAGSQYLGFEYNTDDHMVYAAWMHQAMSGRFFFDNRFTTDAQPSLTVHLYFWGLGQIARLTGIPLAANLGRLAFTALFVPLLYGLVRRVSGSVFMTRLAVVVTILGGGIGFLVWQNFGVLITKPTPEPVSNLMLGRLPIDTWQPEAFVYPSMLTNGLFMVSLCLILIVLQAFLDAREGWKPVARGAIAIGLLMNIHSYDVLLMAFVMLGFAAMQMRVGKLTGPWLLRGAVIACGAIPAALWFVHVLQADPVFQARAATPTYSANFRSVFFGFILMFLLAFPGLYARFKGVARIGLAILIALILGLFVAAAYAPSEGYFLSPALWVVCAAIAVAALCLMATEEPALNLVIAWGVMGLIAIYFPALFQRKLAMGLGIPWAILATIGFAELVRGRDRNARNLATVLVILVLSATSIRWIFRDKELIDDNVANTTVHPVFLSRDEQQILALLNDDKRSRIIAAAMPGAPSPALDANGRPIPDLFETPAMPDLNPIISGMAGAYTFAGHWSETPDYGRRRAMLTAIFLARTPESERQALLARIGPDYVVAPAPETYPEGVADLRSLGQVVYDGAQFKLIRIR